MFKNQSNSQNPTHWKHYVQICSYVNSKAICLPSNYISFKFAPQSAKMHNCKKKVQFLCDFNFTWESKGFVGSCTFHHSQMQLHGTTLHWMCIDCAPIRSAPTQCNALSLPVCTMHTKRRDACNPDSEPTTEMRFLRYLYVPRIVQMAICRTRGASTWWIFANESQVTATRAEGLHSRHECQGAPFNKAQSPPGCVRHWRPGRTRLRWARPGTLSLPFAAHLRCRSHDFFTCEHFPYL